MGKKTLKNVVKASRSVVSFVATIFVYFCIAIIVVVLVQSNGEPQGFNLVGYSPLYIKTQSMQSVMPAGSFVLIKEDVSNHYQIGDDITFFDEHKDGMIITHRIIDVLDDYEHQGMAYVTKGVDNPNQDAFPVFASNVMGKVIWVVPELGIFLSFIQDNVFLVVLCGLIFIAFLNFLIRFIKIIISERVNVKEESEDLI